MAKASDDDPPLHATVGVFLARQLAGAGVQHVFGVPGGGSNLDLIEALRTAGIEWVLTRTETAAAFMAAAGAEAGQRLGVVVVGNGPGLSSVVNGVAQAYLDRAPLLVISDRFTDVEASASGHQILDQRALLKPVVKAGWTLAAADAPRAIHDALVTAMSPPRGPVHLDVPRDLLNQTLGQSPTWPTSGSPAEGALARWVLPPAPPVGDAIDLMAAGFAGARWPIILVGLEANGIVSPEPLCELAERWRAPVLTTYKAKGIFDEYNSWWGGILTGGYLESPLVGRADRALAIGLDSVELLSEPWRFTMPVESLRSSTGADRHLEPLRTVVGDLELSLRALLARTDGDRASRWQSVEVAATTDVALSRLRLGDSRSLRTWSVIETLRSAAPTDALLTVDAGAHMLLATWFWRTSVPQSFLISNGLGTMGFAVPSAIGAAVGNPERVTVAVTGDGGAAYHLTELETARRVGARLIVIVLNDSSLSLIRVKNEAKGNDRAGLDYRRVDFATVASGLGAAGHRAATSIELSQAFAAALEADIPTLIDVQLDGAEYLETLRRVRG